jgi:hypothetical protein
VLDQEHFPWSIVEDTAVGKQESDGSYGISQSLAQLKPEDFGIECSAKLKVMDMMIARVMHGEGP